MMKKLLITTFATLFLCACTTTNPSTGQKEFDPAKTEKVKAAVEPIIQGGIRHLLADNPDHQKELANYLHSAANIFCAMSANRNFSPEYLIDEANRLTAPILADQVKDQYLLDVKDAVIALYKINYADRFRVELPPEEWAFQVSQLFCNSINQALKDSQL